MNKKNNKKTTKQTTTKNNNKTLNCRPLNLHRVVKVTEEIHLCITLTLQTNAFRIKQLFLFKISRLYISICVTAHSVGHVICSLYELRAYVQFNISASNCSTDQLNIESIHFSF